MTLQPSVTWPIVYKMVVPGSGGKEYFLFENRQNIGFDKGLLAWRMGSDGGWITAPMHGLAIYHVDETVFSRNTGVPNEAENWKEFRSTGWRKAWTGETHYGISVLQADDRWDLEHGYNSGDDGRPVSRQRERDGDRQTTRVPTPAPTTSGSATSPGTATPASRRPTSGSREASSR